jgi:hypothetical protein
VPAGLKLPCSAEDADVIGLGRDDEDGTVLHGKETGTEVRVPCLFCCIGDGG